MYIPEYGYKTIKKAQIELLNEILNNGEEVENLLEINNISVFIEHPLKDHEELFKNVTKTAAKHMDQMMLKPNPKLPKTHYDRLHKYVVPDNNTSYDQVEECIERLKENPFSKRCILTLWQPQDISDPYALSWTMSQVMIRNNKLIMTNYFRGCDIWNAFKFNCLGIAILQKDISHRLGKDIGEFVIHIGSSHIYKNHIEEVKEYLSYEEGK